MSQLTRSVQDRLFVGLLSAIFAPACGYVLVFGHGPPSDARTDWVIRLFFLLLMEGISVVFSVAVFGLIWAIWTPDWIERRLKTAFFHFLFLVFAVSVFVTAICVYMFVVSAGSARI